MLEPNRRISDPIKLGNVLLKDTELENRINLYESIIRGWKLIRGLFSYPKTQKTKSVLILVSKFEGIYPTRNETTSQFTGSLIRFGLSVNYQS